MLNLLSFVPGKKEEYLKYGAAFAKSIGSRHGGEAKIVGNVIHQENERSKADASANGAAAAGYMIPGQAAGKSSGRNGNTGASTSGPSASGLMVEEKTAKNNTRSDPKAGNPNAGVSATKAHTAGYKIPDEAQNPRKINTTANSDASAAGYMIPSSFPTQGASASGAPSSGLMIETESSPSTSTASSSPSSSQNHGASWDEIAIAHYPSLSHFAAMAGSKDYQFINKKHRVPSLRDTFILCTMEIGDNGELAGKGGGAKL